MSWLDTTRTIAALPAWIDRIRALEQLAIDPAVTIERVVADTDGEVDAGDDPHFVFWRVAVDVLARRMPSEQWIPLLAALSEAEMTHARMVIVEMLPTQYASALVPAAIAALPSLPRQALRRIDAAWRWDQPQPAALVAAWPAITALAAHEDPIVAIEAAMLAARGTQVTPMVVTVLARELESAVKTTEPDGYDEQVNIEELLGLVAKSGPALRELAPSLVPYLRCKAMAWRAAAAHAAAGIGAFTLRKEIETALGRVKKKDLGAQIERSLFLYASWLFGGPTDSLARATAIAGESIVSLFRLRQTFAVSTVDDRLLAALRGVADDLAWTANVCGVLASFGAPAAATVASIPAPLTTDEAYTPWVVARYRCGVATRDETRVALEAHLAWHAWDLYVELAVEDPIAEARLRAELAGPPRDPIQECVPHIAAHPALGARLVPQLRANGYDDLIQALWRQGVPLA